MIQDELLLLCADYVRQKIIEEVETTGVFGLMCDEARYEYRNTITYLKYNVTLLILSSKKRT